MRIGIVAGEASGDALGGALITALRARCTHLEVHGVAGPQLRAAGCEPLAGIEALSVMGLAEVISHLPRLLALRKRLVRQFLGWRPDVFIGVDAPDFNLGLAARLRCHGIRTVQYVSPTVWAWRRGRVRTIARAADRVLTLFPFETAAYAGSGVEARWVGHPLAATLPAVPATDGARAALGLSPVGPVLALLPGSRAGEWARHAQLFVQAAAGAAQRVPGLECVAALARPDARAVLEAALAGVPGLRCTLVDGHAHAVMAASDAVLAASGTVTLEAALIGRPMVVAYRVAPLTYAIARHLVRTPHVALPNLVLGRDVVPEFIQHAATPDALADALVPLFGPQGASMRTALAGVRAALGPADPAGAAADAVLELTGLPT